MGVRRRGFLVLVVAALAVGAGDARAQSCDPYHFVVEWVQPPLHIAQRSIALRVVWDCNCCSGHGNVSSSDRLRLEAAEGRSSDYQTVPFTVRDGLVHWRPERPGTYRLRFHLPRAGAPDPRAPIRTAPVVVRVLDPDRPDDARVAVRLRIAATAGVSNRLDAIWPESPVLDADEVLRGEADVARLRPRRRPSESLSLPRGRYVLRTGSGARRGWACFEVTGPGDVEVSVGGTRVPVDDLPAGATWVELVSECGYRALVEPGAGGSIVFEGVPRGRALLIAYRGSWDDALERVSVRELTID
ncbi:MAG: hypothetical protein R3B82_16350 [Sandaracinaceae bacterium]